ncbi:M48 family metallopeptidase [Rufibacter soli]
MKSGKKESALQLGIVEKEIEAIGTVRFIPSATAKYVRISIRPGQGVRVTLPRRASMAQAEAFVQEKSSWIRKHLVSQQQEQHRKTLFTPELAYNTRFHQLQLQPHSLPHCKSRLKDGILHVWYPQTIGYAHEDVQDYIQKAIEYTLRLEAKEHLPQRVAYFARQFNFSYQQVTIKNAKTRWGSCSATNNINLNLHLMRLPAHLCDYVILHELAHTVEKNHGPRFWALLDKISGDAKGLDKQLKAYRLQIL